MTLQKYQNHFFALPIIASVIALICIGMWGLKPGIELIGGSLLQVSYPDGRPHIEEVYTEMEKLNLGEVLVQPSDDKDLILRQKELNPTEKAELLKSLGQFGNVEEVQFNSVGPSIGTELVRKAWWAISLVTLSIIIFIAFAFRGVSKPVASWKYGVVAIVTLLHDILIPTGLFAYLGHTDGAEVGVLFIVALLTILGISINDTIVVFDRIRENLRLNIERNKHEGFKDLVWRSVVQTMARSINTSLTVIMVLAALFYVGPESTKDFALTLIIGMVVGTYSSIFLAAPLLVLIEKYQKVTPKK